MDIKKLLTKKHTTLYSQEVDGRVLAVKETNEHRWFELGGQVIQSLMNKDQPEQLLTPVSQSLLLFLLWKNKPLKVLNLGLGGASLERALATMSNVLITAVEASEPVIAMAQQYFKLPKKVQVICQKAEVYIQQVATHITYDVVLCDLFIDEKSPDFLFTQDFYCNVKKIAADKAVLIINLQAETDEQLLNALFAIKQHFPHIALIEFDEYKNIVIICSLDEIPTRDVLAERLKTFTHIDFTYLNNIIEKIRYIPHSKS